GASRRGLLSRCLAHQTDLCLSILHSPRLFFFFKQKTAYEIGLGIPAEPLFRSFKRPVSSWKALNLRKTLLMASSVRLKPLNCSRLPCVYAQETLTFLLTQKKTCVKNYVQKE